MGLLATSSLATIPMAVGLLIANLATDRLAPRSLVLGFPTKPLAKSSLATDPLAMGPLAVGLLATAPLAVSRTARERLSDCAKSV